MDNYIKTIIISLCIILSIFIVSYSFVNRNKSLDVISVTGIGKMDFEADLTVWIGYFRRINPNLQAAYKTLNEDKKIIENFLKNKNITPPEYIFSSVYITKEYETYLDSNNNQHEKFIGFRLEQNIKIESNDVDKIEQLSREITEIINKGVEFYSEAPQYFYTKLDDIKLAVIAEATKNARLRAEKITEHSKGRLGKLKYANLGVFQITAQNSDESFTWSGAYDTGSKRKSAFITVKLQYSLK